MSPPHHHWRLHHFPAKGLGGQPPLLFIHGGFTHAACWAPHFIPYFQARGHDCHALDLSGHGAAEGRERLDSFGLGDYVADLAEAVDTLTKPPVLVGHSMGTRVVQDYLEKGATVAAAVLLAPIPPSGTAGSALRLAFNAPGAYGALIESLGDGPSRSAMETLVKVYFSPDMDIAEASACLPLLQTESRQAVLELLAPVFRTASARSDPPILVMGGAEDAVFPPALLRFTAAPWRAPVEIIPGAGHMLMLDPQWEDAAERILRWLRERPIPGSK